MVYEWKTGSRHKTDPQKAGMVFEELAKDGRLNAPTLVDVSRPEDAPLHKEFEWKDDVAAEEWRKHQARNLINAIVVREEEKTEAVPIRAFFIVEERTGNYEPTTVILRDEAKTNALKEQCLKELMNYKWKYTTVLEAANAMGDLETAQAKLRVLHKGGNNHDPR